MGLTATGGPVHATRQSDVERQVLPDAEAWWRVVWNAGFRRMLKSLDPEGLRLIARDAAADHGTRARVFPNRIRTRWVLLERSAFGYRPPECLVWRNAG